MIGVVVGIPKSHTYERPVPTELFTKETSAGGHWNAVLGVSKSAIGLLIAIVFVIEFTQLFMSVAVNVIVNEVSEIIFSYKCFGADSVEVTASPKSHAYVRVDPIEVLTILRVSYEQIRAGILKFGAGNVGLIYLIFVESKEQFLSSVAVRVTSYEPAVVYIWLGFWSDDAVLASPKFQEYD